jgi:hypothetical protein
MQMDGSSGPAGLNIFAYTWQFGNGLSATLSAEDAFARSAGVLDVSQSGFAGAATVDTKGQSMPDIVANLRVDQGWGSAQIMGSIHQVGGRYWANDFINPSTCAQGNTTNCGHPSDQYGWAVGAGLTLKMPWDAKDTLSGVIAYAEGHSRAVAFGMTSNFVHRQSIGGGIWSDGIFRSPGVISGYDGSIELTTTWGGTVAFEHYWTPSLRTSWVFGYVKTEYSDTAKQLIRQNTDANVALGAGKACQSSAILVPNSQCDPDWAVWRLASRTMWNPVANLDVGLEVAYTKVDTAWGGATGFVPATNAHSLGSQNNYGVDDQSFWSATLRVQRSFWP